MKNYSIFLLFLIAPFFVEADSAGAGLIHKAGFFAKSDKIDGPDFFENEPAFKRAYESLKSTYGNDHLPDKLPRELLPIRDRIYSYIQRNADGRITGRGTHYAGANGKNNGKDFDYSKTGLPDKLTRLSFCFGISPRILTTLVEKESEFIGSAISATGAVGFMQITNVAAVEVSEQLGYNNPHVAYSKSAARIYHEYIDCFLKSDKKWAPPWAKSQKRNGAYVMHPNCRTALRNCVRGSKRLRTLKGPYSSRVDKWLKGKWHGSSQDNGLIYGAVLLKYHLGHSGIVKGLQKYNADRKVKVRYSRTIRRKARGVNLQVRDYRMFGQDFQIHDGGDEDLIGALDVISRATSSAWDEEDGVEVYDREVIETLKELELPGHDFGAGSGVEI